ncbi:MAG: LysM peptidoglycan-binding domain-containing protein [Proteobacteria bacterium]|nr:LysM peptidoglycan-binding domain-containing protein [Candidatus Enterousia scatequi]
MAISKTKNSTDDMISSAIHNQNSWHRQRKNFTRKFWKKQDTFAKTNPDNKKPNTLRSYWFPILCAFIVIILAIVVAGIRLHKCHSPRTISVVPEPIVQPVDVKTPTFDIVRIEKSGSLVVAGRWKPDSSVSVYVNDKLLATEQTDNNGEFVYAPVKPLTTGNYTLYLVGSAPETQSENKVFLYVSPAGWEDSISLLMTRDGSTLMQTPKTLADGDLVISKIDYLADGRLVVSGDGLPRLRVSLDLDGKYVGFARVSEYKHFGLGADVGDLKPGREYVMTMRLHDGDGRTIAAVKHKFDMPEMTGDDDTFYTVRRGDCLWIIARNFMRRGILFSMIAQRNNIENPDLIFPKQVLSIPVKSE